MNRREMVILPGMALAASGLARAQQAAVTPSKSSGGLSHKAIARYGRLKAFYTIPKSEAKLTKYISFLSTLLSLSPAQQTQAAGIFGNASTSHATVKKSMKTVRQSLAEAVRNNDSAGINQTSVAIGTLAAQQHAIGAGANAAFFLMLSGTQQATLNQFRS